LLIARLMLLVALAQPSPPPAEANLAFQRGKAAFDAGSFEAAITEFAVAYRLHASVTVLYNLALAHDAAGHGAESLALFRRLLADLPGAAPAEAARVRRFETLIHARIRELERAAGGPADAGAGASPRDAGSEAGRDRGAEMDATPPVARARALTPDPARAEPPGSVAAGLAPGVPAPPAAAGRARWLWVALGVAAATAVVATILIAGRNDCPRTELGCTRTTH
jgi:hypothetical protein